ncbi:MAG TPA: DinB family protein [Thermoanaerobaculia bacterium]|jgi:uncharacterized damage-inducible protein DinB
MEEPLVETWTIHNRINLYLLEAVPAEALGSTLAPKHRSIGQIFAHVHNVRLMWLKAATPDLLEGVAKLEGIADKATLAGALEASGRSIEALLRKSLAAGGKIKGFKPHATAFVGYLISHESHHRSQVVWTLKNTGHPLDQKISYGLWEWGVR